MLRTSMKNPGFSRKISRRETTLQSRGAIVALAAAGMPLGDITSQFNNRIPRRTISHVIERAIAKSGTIEEASDALQDDDLLKDAPRSGRPQLLSRDQVASLIKHATSDAAHRRMTWEAVAEDLGIKASRSTIHR